jgi:hypothetical protein
MEICHSGSDLADETYVRTRKGSNRMEAEAAFATCMVWNRSSISSPIARRCGVGKDGYSTNILRRWSGLHATLHRSRRSIETYTSH